MMDTILDLGLNEATAAGLAAMSGDPGFAADCLRRFRQMYRDIVGCEAPDDPWLQLRGAVEAVFWSWNCDRARAYRAHEGIPDDLGTGVTVQAMVFGNWGADSGTGVLFTRSPATGDPALYGDVMFRAQGEDVVAGTHKPQPLAMLDDRLPPSRPSCAGTRTCSSGTSPTCVTSSSRSSAASCGCSRYGWASAARGRRCGSPSTWRPTRTSRARERRRCADRAVPGEPAARLRTRRPGGRPRLTAGLPASPGVATGEIVTTPEAAELADAAGRPVILVRAETSPSDVRGMAHAAGILTARGGLASHAAVVARGWGIPAVVGAAAVEVSDGQVIIAGPRARAQASTCPSTAAPARYSRATWPAAARSRPRRPPCLAGRKSSASMSGAGCWRRPGSRRTRRPPGPRHRARPAAGAAGQGRCASRPAGGRGGRRARPGRLAGRRTARRRARRGSGAPAVCPARAGCARSKLFAADRGRLGADAGRRRFSTAFRPA